MPNLKWNVKKDEKGKFLRRKIEGDFLHDFDYIDVEWTCDGGFPEDTVTVPVTHPPNIQYEVRKVEARKVIHDQLGVSPKVSDSSVAAMLDEKLPTLAEALGLKP